MSENDRHTRRKLARSLLDVNSARMLSINSTGRVSMVPSHSRRSFSQETTVFAPWMCKSAEKAARLNRVG